MSPGTLSYYQQYTDGMEPCILSLPESVVGDRAPLSGSVALPALRPELVQNADLLATLASAWGLILSFYTGNREVVFAVQDRQTAHVVTTLCRVNADPADTIESCLSRLRLDLTKGEREACKTIRKVMVAAGRDSSERLCNTALLAFELGPPDDCFDSCEVR
jgi:hypothetical protein